MSNVIGAGDHIITSDPPTLDEILYQLKNDKRVSYAIEEKNRNIRVITLISNHYEGGDIRKWYTDDTYAKEELYYPESNYKKITDNRYFLNEKLLIKWIRKKGFKKWTFLSYGSGDLLRVKRYVETGH